jgi:hypothetical protein
MSLDNGTISFRVFYLSDAAALRAADILEAMARRAAPDLAAVTEKALGWAGPRSLLDRDLSAGNCVCGDWLRVNLTQVERKVPESLLKAACQAEEALELKARGGEYLARQVRAEIKQRVAAGLRQQAQPSLDGIGVWINLRTFTLIAEATTDGKIDRVSPAVKDALGLLPIGATADTAALVLGNLNRNDLEPAHFCGVDVPHEVCLGMEFLTFLFWRYERDGGAFRLEVHGAELGYMLEGPLTFYREGQGAHEVGIRKGSPLNSREAVTCLAGGKLLRKAKFVLADGGDIYSAMVDESFCFQSVKLPKGEGGTAYERAVERARHMVVFITAWFGLYKQFVQVRADAKAWALAAGEIREWIAARNGGAN